MTNRKQGIKSRSLPRRLGRYNPPKNYFRKPEDAVVQTIAVQQAERVLATAASLHPNDRIQFDFNDGGRAAFVAVGRVMPNGTLSARQLAVKKKPTKEEHLEHDSILTRIYRTPSVDKARIEVELAASDGVGGVAKRMEAFQTRYITRLRKDLN